MKTIIIIILVMLSGNIFSQNTKDSIEIKRHLGNSFKYQGKYLVPSQLREIISVNPEAVKEMKRARYNKTFGTIFGFAGGAMLGYTVGTYMSTYTKGAKTNWTIAAAGVGFVLITIPFSVANNQHITKAVRIYNEGIRQTTDSKKLNFNLGFTPNGFRICMSF